MDEETNWEKYRESISRAKKNYLSKKKGISLILTPEEFEEIKSYCEAQGISMQSFIKESALDRVRS